MVAPKPKVHTACDPQNWKWSRVSQEEGETQSNRAVCVGPMKPGTNHNQLLLNQPRDTVRAEKQSYRLTERQSQRVDSLIPKLQKTTDPVNITA